MANFEASFLQLIALLLKEKNPKTILAETVNVYTE